MSAAAAAAMTSPHLHRPRRTSLSYPQLAPRGPVERAHVFFRSLLTLPWRQKRSWRSFITVTNVLRLLWILVILWGERWVYHAAFRECAWENWEQWPESAQPERVALVADPQLVDPHTYARRGIALWATQFYTDLYMHRNWRSIQEGLAPSTTVFLGDLFDGGREWAADEVAHPEVEDAIPKDPRAHGDWDLYGQEYWEAEYARFESVFPEYEGAKIARSLPGNHDLGFGNGVRESVKTRFERWFGPTNRELESGNHSLVLLDSVSIMADSAALNTPSKAFLDEISSEEALYPRLLFSHVPLYRDRNTPCGPYREKGNSLPVSRGYQYQTVLSPEVSSDILDKVRPKLVFSGDDHDACEVVHTYGPDPVREITVKAFSWCMGVRKPGFYLLSLHSPGEGEGERAETTVEGRHCILPDQIGIFLKYVQMLVFTLAVVLVEAVRSRGADREVLKPLLPVGSIREEDEHEAEGLLGSVEKRGGGKRRRCGVLRKMGTEMGAVAGVVLLVYAWLVWSWW